MGVRSRAASEGKWSFSPKAQKKFAEFNEACGEFLQNPGKIELLASVRFVKNMWCSDIGKADFANEFKKHKKQLCKGREASNEEIEEAFEICERHLTNLTN